MVSSAKCVMGATRAPTRSRIPALDPARASGAGLSTPMARTTSETPLATSRHAWANAVDPEADAFSTCAIGIPVAPRWRSMARVGATPSSAVPL